MVSIAANLPGRARSQYDPKDLLGIGVFSFVQVDLRANIGVRYLLSAPSGHPSTPIEHYNRNRGSGPAIRPINRYPPRLRCWLRARPRKVRDRVPPVSSGSYGTYPAFHCLTRTSHENSRSVSGLLFTCRALENVQADQTSELRACFKRSYDDVLRHHHGWFIQSAVSVRVGNAL